MEIDTLSAFNETYITTYGYFKPKYSGKYIFYLTSDRNSTFEMAIPTGDIELNPQRIISDSMNNVEMKKMAEVPYFVEFYDFFEFPS